MHFDIVRHPGEMETTAPEQIENRSARGCSPPTSRHLALNYGAIKVTTVVSRTLRSARSRGSTA